MKREYNPHKNALQGIVDILKEHITNKDCLTNDEEGYSKEVRYAYLVAKNALL